MMEETYTVGVRLALDDGVSAGLAAIEGQLAALDATLAARMGEFRRLQLEGRAAGDRPIVEAVRQLPGTAGAGAAMRDPAGPHPEPVQSSHRAALPEPVAMSMPAVPSVDLPLVPARPGSAPIHGSRAESVIVNVERRLALPAGVAVPDRKAEPMAEARAPTARRVDRIGQDVMPRRGWAEPTFVPPALPVAMPEARVRPEAMPAEPAIGAAPVLRWPHPVAPPIALEPRWDAPQETSQAPSPTARSDDGIPAASPTTQGDILLDGARLGRWIVNRLARDAERPQAGGTAFDGRMSPAWGGTL